MSFPPPGSLVRDLDPEAESVGILDPEVNGVDEGPAAAVTADPCARVHLALTITAGRMLLAFSLPWSERSVRRLSDEVVLGVDVSVMIASKALVLPPADGGAGCNCISEFSSLGVSDVGGVSTIDGARDVSCDVVMEARCVVP